MYKQRGHWSFLGALTLLWCGVASAHMQMGATTTFVGGLTHPVTGLDHVVAMVAVGLWGAQLGAPAIWLLPVTFPMVMAFGGMLGILGVPLPGVEIGIGLSAVLLGIMVAGELRPPLPVACALVAFFAIFHGHAHGAELPPGGDGVLYSIGFVIATGSLHVCGILIGLIDRWPWGKLVMRTGGVGIAVTGMVFLFVALG